MDRLIALLTDYGHRDAYVGILKGVIHSICPTARIVDVCHELPPQSIYAGCHLLSECHAHFPEGTIFVSVVDPGVGTERRSVAARTDRHVFVAPDNGLLSFVKPKEIRVLDNDAYHRNPVSPTFHGRDIFAPVAAHLAAGVPFASLGSATRSLVRLKIAPFKKSGKKILGRVLWIDRFGNLVTNIPESEVAGPSSVTIRGTTVKGLSRTYGEHGKGDLIALIGSGGHLEISLVQGSAAGALGAAIGDPVEVRRP